MTDLAHPIGVQRSTRETLMDTAELLFADRGVQGATTREIIESADQRNVSALTYHFGSRENLLLEILARRGVEIDAERGSLRERLSTKAEPAELMECLVEPYAAQLHTDGGRAYLRIVAQLRGRFAAWRVDSDEATTVNLALILDELAAFVDGPSEVRDARLLGMITLLTGLVAERAQAIDAKRALPLDHGSFCTQVISMCTAILLA